MALTIPTTFKLTQLKALAFKCGILTSGTKHTLTRRLLDEIPLSPQNASSPIRILSIDMGIRNLAYCILDVPEKSANMADMRPSIRAWHRLAVSTAPAKPEDENAAMVKEAFDPATLSSKAYTLLRKRLLLEAPTHILIERQRFRSMGSKHILEWTVRVNMFESILHAVLTTLKEEGLWKGNVQTVLPGKVGPFWVGEEEEGREGVTKERKSKSAKIKNKGLKIDLVKSWLQSGEMVVCGNEGVEKMAEAYKEKWDRGPGGLKGKKNKTGELEEKMGKLDDLADCLLQGMAWIQWEENKRIAMKYGAEALLSP
jgi:cruciform cutting endonuclease 1